VLKQTKLLQDPNSMEKARKDLRIKKSMITWWLLGA